MKQSKVSKALAYLKSNPDQSIYAACKAVGVSKSSVYARIRMDKAKSENRCPACGQNLGRTTP